MKPAPFAYARPDSLDEALELLNEQRDAARVLAGGQSLGAMLNMRLLRPRVLIDICGLAAIGGLERQDNMIEIGAAVTQGQLLGWPGLSGQPLLRLMLPWVGHYQTRNRGTVCGSLVHADPSSELPLALALLDGEVVLRNRKRRRTVRAADFQTGLMQTDLRDDEMVVAARFPVARPDEVAAFHEVGQRQGDFAMVAVAVVADPSGLKIAVGGVADTPVVRRLPWLEGTALADALNALAWELRAGSDVHASDTYRRTLVRNIGARVIGEARHAVFGS